MVETLPLLVLLLIGPIALLALGCRVLVWAVRGMQPDVAAEPPEPDGPGGLRVLRGGGAASGRAPLRRAA